MRGEIISYQFDISNRRENKVWNYTTFHFGCISKWPDILMDMCRHFISGSVFIIFYHPTWNFIYVKITDMKSIIAIDIQEKLWQRRRRRWRKAIAKRYAKIYSSRERESTTVSIWCHTAMMEILLFITQQKENDRTSHRKCSLKNGVLKNFAKFAGKDLCQSLFFHKVTGFRPAILLKRRLWQNCFTVNFANILRTHFLQKTSRRPLLKMKAIPAK